jgi:hypothetical protein
MGINHLLELHHYHHHHHNTWKSLSHYSFLVEDLLYMPSVKPGSRTILKVVLCDDTLLTSPYFQATGPSGVLVWSQQGLSFSLVQSAVIALLPFQSMYVSYKAFWSWLLTPRRNCLQLEWNLIFTWINILMSSKQTVFH